MRSYFKALARVLLELAMFAIGVVVLTVFVQAVGAKFGILALVLALFVIVLLLAALRKGE